MPEPETADRPTGPVPQGSPPAEASSAGPSPGGHPSGSVEPTATASGEQGQTEEDDAGHPAAVPEVEIEPVEADLAKLAAERDEYREALQRLQADFENYRKRVVRQQTDHLERAAQDLVEKLLGVLDTFDLALAHGGEGLEQGHQALVAVLEKEGLERVGEPGEPFDPTRHDAVAHEPAAADGAVAGGDDGAGAGPRVAEVMRAGYRWKGRTIRPAMVKVQG